MSSRQGTMSNRRKLARITTRMPARVRKVSGWWRRGSQGECQVMDYNRFGAGLLLARALPVGSRLLLDLNAGHFVLRRLPAEVVSCVRDGRSYRVGVRFYRNLGELASGQASASLTLLYGLEESLTPPPVTG
ncbi:PilZ domain-containing protein [Alcanivorax sp. 1008]|uniref:PilZ domain-containing protein n=1 Tax=Alcanivorax sp. 1008 TaxID=2816853 RepID=UPI001DE8EC83|nr:PilZ domain-containing protein [Alcanivorax sp. 1008]MCC1496374.1 PilZ domain-containing protein [Alcanivorax sp. 1008]